MPGVKTLRIFAAERNHADRSAAVAHGDQRLRTHLLEASPNHDDVSKPDVEPQ